MRPARKEAGVVELVTEIVRGSYALLDAAVGCADRPDLFEPRRGDEPRESFARRQNAALDICDGCDALLGCRMYLGDLGPAAWPGWVVAGRRVPTGYRGQNLALDVPSPMPRGRAHSPRNP